MYEEKAVFKAAATSFGVTAGAWMLTDAVFGFWGLVLGVPATLASTVWLAHRTKKIVS